MPKARRIQEDPEDVQVVSRKRVREAALADLRRQCAAGVVPGGTRRRKRWRDLPESEGEDGEEEGQLGKRARAGEAADDGATGQG